MKIVLDDKQKLALLKVAVLELIETIENAHYQVTHAGTIVDSIDMLHIVTKRTEVEAILRYLDKDTLTLRIM